MGTFQKNVHAERLRSHRAQLPDSLPQRRRWIAAPRDHAKATCITYCGSQVEAGDIGSHRGSKDRYLYVQEFTQSSVQHHSSLKVTTQRSMIRDCFKIVLHCRASVTDRHLSPESPIIREMLLETPAV